MSFPMSEFPLRTRIRWRLRERQYVRKALNCWLLRRHSFTVLTPRDAEGPTLHCWRCGKRIEFVLNTVTGYWNPEGPYLKRTLADVELKGIRW